jgi:hypothetical protein
MFTPLGGGRRLTEGVGYLLYFGWCQMNRHTYQVIETGNMGGLRRLVEEEGMDVNDTEDEFGTFPLLLACMSDRLEAAQYLLDHGANINKTGGGWWTALMVACMQRHLEMVRLLLSRGASPSIRDSGGRTALFHASYGGDVEIIRLLNQTGRAEVNARSDGGATALHAACSCGHIEAVRVLLLECRADPHVADTNGQTAMTLLPLTYVPQRNHERCVELLQVGGVVHAASTGALLSISFFLCIVAAIIIATIPPIRP